MNAFWWAVLAAVIWGIVPILEKLALIKVEPMVGLFYRLIGGVLAIMIMGTLVLKPSQIRSVDPKSIVFLVIAGFLGSFVAVVAFYYGLKTGEVSLVVPVSGSFYLVAFILGIIFLGETLTLMKVLAVLLITAGLWILKGTV